MPTFSAVPLRTGKPPQHQPSLTLPTQQDSNAAVSQVSSLSASGSGSASSARGPQLSSMLVGSRQGSASARVAASREGRRTNPHHLTGLGPNASWDDDRDLQPSRGIPHSSVSNNGGGGGILGYRGGSGRPSTAAVSNGVVLTGGGIRRQHSAGQPTVQSLLPVRPALSSAAPVPPKRGPLTVQQLLAEQHQLQQEEEQANQTTKGKKGSSAVTAGGGGGGEDDIYSTALLQEMNGSRATTRPIAPRRRAQSTLWLVPMELLLDLFTYLDYRSVCFSGAVSVRWKITSENPLIWRAIAARCGKGSVPLTPHCNAKEVMKRYILTHRAQMEQEMVVVQSQLQDTNRRLEQRLQEMPPFVAPLIQEHDAPEVRRLPTVITSAEGKMSEMNSKIDSFSQLQQTLTRTQRENKNALVRTEGELKKAEALLEQVKNQQQQEANLQGFELFMVKALTEDLDSELPVVLRRGLTTFFELELLVLQTTGGMNPVGSNSQQQHNRSRLACRWDGFKRTFPLDDTWTNLRSRLNHTATQQSAVQRARPRLTEKESALLAHVTQLRQMSERDLKKYVENL